MKRTLIFVLSLAVIFVLLVGCSNPTGNTTPSPATSSGTTESTIPAPEATPAAPDTVYTIKFGITNTVTNMEDPEAVYAMDFKKYIDENSGGRIKIEFYPNLQLGSMEEQRDMIMAGTLEMMLSNMNTIGSVAPKSMALPCPGLFRNEEEINAVMASEWGRNFMKDIAEETNLYAVSVVSNGMRCFTSSKAPLTTVETAKGVTFRVMKNPLCVAMVEGLGANAVPMAGSEMYAAMQNGTVDGQENPINPIINDKTFEVQKYMVVDKHMPSIDGIFIGYKFFKGLPEDLQQVIQGAADFAAKNFEVGIERVSKTGLEFLKTKLEVYVPTQEELDAWHAPMYEASYNYLVGQGLKEVLDDLEAQLKAYRAANP